MNNQSHETVKQIRREFFVYRNGLLADKLRENGDPHRMIFGLNLSQITEMANRFDIDENVAIELWSSKETRECRLIAPMLFPIDKFTQDLACGWIASVECTEVADNLCHKLLKNLPYADKLCLLYAQGTILERYTALVLAVNLITIGKTLNYDAILTFAQEEQRRNDSITILIANRLIDDVKEILSIH